MPPKMGPKNTNHPPPKKPVIGLFGLLFSILCPTVIAWIIIGCFIRYNIFYVNGKPKWFPAEELSYPLFWGTYMLLGAATYLVWQIGTGVRGFILPQLFNVIQLLANYAWLILFFEKRFLQWALVACSIQWVAALTTTIFFSCVHKKTLFLTIPYLLWYGCVLALNIQLSFW